MKFFVINHGATDAFTCYEGIEQDVVERTEAASGNPFNIVDEATWQAGREAAGLALSEKLNEKRKAAGLPIVDEFY
jgi:hypothetical protein